MAFVGREEYKRHVWVCGSETTLVEEVVQWFKDRHDQLNTDILVAGSDSEQEIWAALNQYPMPGSKRLVVVREVQEIKDWSPLYPLLAESRRMPDSTMVFVSSESDFPIVDGPGRKLQPHADAVKVKGWVVRCTNPNDRDLIAWLRNYCPMSEEAGQHLLVRVSRDLSRAKNVCLSVRALGTELTPALVDLLTPQPTDDFVASVMNLDKPAAFAAAAVIPPTTVPKVLGLLDRQLELAQELNGMMRKRMTLPEIVKAGIPSFRAAPLMAAAKHYDAAKVGKCRQILLAVDDTTEHTGVLESVVALW